MEKISLKNVIFDFGGVILKHEATLTEDILQEMFPSTYKEAEKVWKKHRTLMNVGKKTSDDFFVELKKNVDTKLSVDELKTQWKTLYEREAQDVEWELLALVDKLRKTYRVYLFTDTIDVHDEYNRTRNIYTRFDAAYKSYEEGVAKVEGKKAYLHILKKIKAKPEECLFIDDKRENVETAQQVGMKGIVYRDLDQLVQELMLLTLF